jgi:desampylase
VADAPAGLHIAPSLIEALVGAATAAAPFEACGLLVGDGARIVRIVPARNVEASATRYTVAPEDHFAALRSARRDGLEVIGAYHSHPAGDPTPSATDAALATPDFLYVIVGLAPDPAVAAWRFVDGNFVAAGLVRT